MTHIPTHNPRILVVDDDVEIRDLVSHFLQKHACTVFTAADARDMLQQLQHRKIDLIVLDIMMPGEDGLTVCKKLRQHSTLPVIMLTALGDDTDRIIGLELGADDYLAKPFNPRELLARIKAVLRRGTHQTYDSESPDTILFNQWRIDSAKREVYNPDNALVSLTAGEYELLLLFASHPNKVLNRDFLMEATRGRDASPFDRSIDVQISRLRQKIEPDPKNPATIKTVRAGGYIFSAKVSRA